MTSWSKAFRNPPEPGLDPDKKSLRGSDGRVIDEAWQKLDGEVVFFWPTGSLVPDSTNLFDVKMADPYKHLRDSKSKAWVMYEDATVVAKAARIRDMSEIYRRTFTAQEENQKRYSIQDAYMIATERERMFRGERIAWARLLFDDASARLALNTLFVPFPGRVIVYRRDTDQWLEFTDPASLKEAVLDALADMKGGRVTTERDVERHREEMSFQRPRFGRRRVFVRSYRRVHGR